MQVNRVHSVVPAMGLLLLGALATMGIGYGLWAKTLTIDGVVHTGEVDARWVTRVCEEFNSWPDLPSAPEDFGEAEGKNVGTFSVFVDGQDDQILHFQLANVYPSYAIDCGVKYQVEGTIPVIIRGTQILEGPELTNCEFSGDEQTKIMECDELTVWFVDGVGSQVHPGSLVASNLIVHVEQLAVQESTYTFSVQVCMAQWNEGATAQQCFDAGE